MKKKKQKLHIIKLIVFKDDRKHRVQKLVLKWLFAAVILKFSITLLLFFPTSHVNFEGFEKLKIKSTDRVLL